MERDQAKLTLTAHFRGSSLHCKTFFGSRRWGGGKKGLVSNFRAPKQSFHPTSETQKKSCNGDSILGSVQRGSILPDRVPPNRFTPIIQKLSFWVANPGKKLVSHFRCGESWWPLGVEKPEGRTEETGTRKAAYVVPVDENRYKSQEWLSLTDKAYDKC